MAIDRRIIAIQMLLKVYAKAGVPAEERVESMEISTPINRGES